MSSCSFRVSAGKIMKKVGKSDGYELGKIKRGGKGEKEKVQSTASTLTGYSMNVCIFTYSVATT